MNNIVLVAKLGALILGLLFIFKNIIFDKFARSKLPKVDREYIEGVVSQMMEDTKYRYVQVKDFDQSFWVALLLASVVSIGLNQKFLISKVIDAYESTELIFSFEKMYFSVA